MKELYEQAVAESESKGRRRENSIQEGDEMVSLSETAKIARERYVMQILLEYFFGFYYFSLGLLTKQSFYLSVLFSVLVSKVIFILNQNVSL